MLHNEIEQSVLTAQKLALESLRKDGLVTCTETPAVNHITNNNTLDETIEVVIKFRIKA